MHNWCWKSKNLCKMSLHLFLSVSLAQLSYINPQSDKVIFEDFLLSCDSCLPIGLCFCFVFFIERTSHNFYLPVVKCLLLTIESEIRNLNLLHVWNNFHSAKMTPHASWWGCQKLYNSGPIQINVSFGHNVCAFGETLHFLTSPIELVSFVLFSFFAFYEFIFYFL